MRERGEIEFSSRRSFKERERSKDYVLAADKKKGNKSFKTEVTKKKTKIKKRIKKEKKRKKVKKKEKKERNASLYTEYIPFSPEY